MKNIIKHILKISLMYCLSFLCISIAVCELIYITQITHELKVTYDISNFKLLFHYGNNQPFLNILKVSFIPCILYLGVLVSKNIDKDKDKNKENYNKLLNNFEVRKGLINVHFDSENVYLTFFDRIKKRLSKITRKLNKFIEKHGRKRESILDIVLFPICHFLFMKNIKFPSVKEWVIEDKEVIKRSGLPIVTKSNHVWLDPTDSHNLITGTSNSGKTFSLLFEMIELTRLAGESAIIVDLKGELSQATYNKFKASGYKCYCIDFINPKESDGWNPLAMGMNFYLKESQRLDEEYDRIIKDIQEKKSEYYRIFHTLNGFTYSEKNKNGEPLTDEYNNPILYPNYTDAQDQFNNVAEVLFDDNKGDNKIWNDFAKDLFLGLLYLLAEEQNPDYVNFSSISKLLETGDLPINPKGRDNKNTYLKQAIMEKRDVACFSRSKLLSYCNGAENTAASIKAVFTAVMNRYTVSQDIENMLATNSIDFDRIGDEKTVIFLKVHDEKSVYYPLVNLFMAQVYESLIANARKNESLRLKVPLNILWDEFGSSPKFEPIKNLLSAGRSRGIRITLVVQGYDQLESKYGKDDARSIKNNVMNKVYLLSGDESTLKEFSMLAGRKKVKKNGRWEDEPIFSTERLSKFSLGEALYIRQRKDPFYTKLLPYDKYVFFSKEKTIFDEKPKPMARWLNATDLTNKKRGN